MTTKAQVTKEKIHWTLSKSKTFASKGIIKKVRRQPAESVKMSAITHLRDTSKSLRITAG